MTTGSANSAGSARTAVLGSIRRALGRDAQAPVAAIPTAARSAPRAAGPQAAEFELLLTEVRKLGGHTQRIPGASGLVTALAELVRDENVTRATLWPAIEAYDLDLCVTLAAAGVSVVPAGAGKEQLATCELGITGVDLALPDSGTLLLRSGPDRPRLVSLLPRVHLALLQTGAACTALCADLSDALAGIQNDGYAVLITGPSRTSDIELTPTIGVHGPKALYVWLLD